MKEEITKCLQKAERSLGDARYLLDDQRLSAAINRAYYAMFNAVLAALFTKDIFTKSHTGAHSKFRELFIKTQQLPSELSLSLSTVFDLRQRADYDYDEVEQIEIAEKALEVAEGFVHAIQAFLASQDY